MTFLFTITKGKPRFKTDYNNVRFEEYCKAHEGQIMRIEAVSGKPSREQAGYYWGAVLPFAKGLVLEWRGLSDDQIHEILKKEFNGFYAFNPLTGEKEKFGQTIASNNSSNRKLMEYIMRIADWVTENYSQTLPDSEEFKRFRDSNV